MDKSKAPKTTTKNKAPCDKANALLVSVSVITVLLMMDVLF